MNYKNLLLTSPQIDEVRDKTLSFGCRVLWGEDHMYPARFVSTVSSGEAGKSRIQESVFNQSNKVETRSLKIIGHPITHADLLRAIGSSKEIGSVVATSYWKGKIVLRTVNNGADYNQDIHLPLNYRTIEDIPEDNPCWEQLCKVFNLI